MNIRPTFCCVSRRPGLSSFVVCRLQIAKPHWHRDEALRMLKTNLPEAVKSSAAMSPKYLLSNRTTLSLNASHQIVCKYCSEIQEHKMGQVDDVALRQQLAALLKGGQAHATLADAVAKFPTNNVVNGWRAYPTPRGNWWSIYGSRFTICWSSSPTPNTLNWNGPAATGRRTRRPERTNPGMQR